jgi:hypothetical protein
MVLLPFVTLAAGLSTAEEPVRGDGCATSDATLLQQREVFCASVVGWTAPWCPSTEAITNTVKKDWPSQVVYFGEIVSTLINPQTCVNTSYAADTAHWLDVYQSKLSLGGSLLQTWASPQGQPNYYEMPRHPGERIESPWTLGMKCWAFAYLVQTWRPAALVSHLQQGNLSIDVFLANYKLAMPLSMNLCDEVMANCFVNASYDPSARNGTCPFSIVDFKAGFGWENVLHGGILKYPFYG